MRLSSLTLTLTLSLSLSLLTVLRAGAARADSAVPQDPPVEALDAMWPDSPKCSVFITVRGEFSSRARDNNNYINAPPTGRMHNPPPSLAVSADELALLNRELVPAVDELARRLKVQRLPNRAAALPPLTLEPDGDRGFSLDVVASPTTDVGGHLGGLDLELTLRSLQRSEAVEGLGSETVKVGVGGGAAQKRELRAALVRALGAARRGLRSSLAVPTAALTLVFQLEGLEPAARADLEQRIAPCAVRLGRAARSIGPTREAEALRFVVDYRLGSGVGADEYARQLAGWIEGEVGPHGKHRCSLQHTALAARRTHVAVSGRTLTVTLQPR